jgi:uncharacterized protein (DUF58 family)
MAFGWQPLFLLGIAILIVSGGSFAFTQTAGAAELLRYTTSVETTRLESCSIVISANLKRRRGVYVEEVRPSAGPVFDFRHLNRTSSCSIAVDTSRRRVGSLPQHEIVCRDWFGVSRKVLQTIPSIPIVVAPRISPLSILPPENSFNEMLFTSPKSLTNPQLAEMVREYRLGDEPRRIHWRSSARAGELMVREEISMKGKSIVVELDTRPQTWNTASRFSNENSKDQFEIAVDLCASVISALLASGREILFVAGDHSVIFDRDGLHTFKRELAAVELSQETSSARSLFVYSARLRKNGETILISRSEALNGSEGSEDSLFHLLEPPLTSDYQ